MTSVMIKNRVKSISPFESNEKIAIKKIKNIAMPISTKKRIMFITTK